MIKHVKQWAINEIAFFTQETYSWWEEPFTVTFVHESRQLTLRMAPYWDGDNRWLIRFTLPAAGAWHWQLHAEEGVVQEAPADVQWLAEPPDSAALRDNANWRGHVRVADGGRHFEFADGTPFFWVGDTNWNAMGGACGLEGPFHEWLQDRKRKGFNLIQTQFFHASAGNAGGLPFPSYARETDDFSEMNPSFFQEADKKMQILWEEGFVIAANSTWIGKQDAISQRSALRFSRMLMNRYGAYNLLWSLAGEYQYSYPTGKRNPIPWTTEQWQALGRHVQERNPYRHPVTVHPSSRHGFDHPSTWPREAHLQSSAGEFHQEEWLDFNWTQTGHQESMLWLVPYRQEENYALLPPKPVLHSEGWYEGHGREERVGGAYDVRWQAWVATLSGSCGQTYGAEGVWPFYDPDRPDYPIPYDTFDALSWQRGIALPGSQYFKPYRAFFESIAWWELIPRRNWVLRNDSHPPLTDLTTPYCAAIVNRLYVVYIPRGNADSHLHLLHLGAKEYDAFWYDPRQGEYARAGTGKALDVKGTGSWPVPAAPDNEDWVLLLARKADCPSGLEELD
ncbi:DUF4038 domain-containing protein [Paenibacillus sp. 1P07SE]|uniref:apiosidase-like domain-containing protein n=1 Tax=Paenibacillus sp. 1P07SE TaxID=3132209 RepID=UPI0039A5BE3A